MGLSQKNETQSIPPLVILRHHRRGGNCNSFNSRSRSASHSTKETLAKHKEGMTGRPTRHNTKLWAIAIARVNGGAPTIPSYGKQSSHLLLGMIRESTKPSADFPLRLRQQDLCKQLRCWDAHLKPQVALIMYTQQRVEAAS